MTIKIPNRLIALKTEDGDIINIDATIVGGKSISFSLSLFKHSFVIAFTRESVKSATQRILDLCKEEIT